MHRAELASAAAASSGTTAAAATAATAATAAAATDAAVAATTAASRASCLRAHLRARPALRHIAGAARRRRLRRCLHRCLGSLGGLAARDQLEVSFTGRSVATLFLLPLLSGALLDALPQGGLTALCFLALVLDRALLALLPRRDALPPVRALLQIPCLRLPPPERASA